MAGAAGEESAGSAGSPAAFNPIREESKEGGYDWGRGVKVQKMTGQGCFKFDGQFLAQSSSICRCISGQA